MFSDLTTLVLGVLGAVVFMAIGIFFNWLFTRTELKKHPLPAEGACVACGSTDLDILAPGVYRCRACGYEGGENRGKMETDATRTAWEGRPWPERIAAARADLVDGQRQLAAIESEMEAVRRGGTPGLLGGPVFAQNNQYGNFEARDERNNALMTLLGSIQAAAAKVRDAALKVPGLSVPNLADAEWGSIAAAQVVTAYDTTRAMVTAALGTVDAMADAADSAANEAAPADGGPKVDPA